MQPALAHLRGLPALWLPVARRCARAPSTLQAGPRDQGTGPGNRPGPRMMVSVATVRRRCLGAGARVAGAGHSSPFPLRRPYCLCAAALPAALSRRKRACSLHQRPWLSLLLPGQSPLDRAAARRPPRALVVQSVAAPPVRRWLRGPGAPLAVAGPRSPAPLQARPGRARRRPRTAACTQRCVRRTTAAPWCPSDQPPRPVPEGFGAPDSESRGSRRRRAVPGGLGPPGRQCWPVTGRPGGG
mmetsp:Transcript_50342/g.114421  ORF Transcript_50342/g.114421 Transcript_50342/m.114421 type:complete len:242 (-) Transcript_50342:520-1245(-)